MLSLKPGDLVDIIAPSSQKNPHNVEIACALLESWGLRPRVPEDIFGPHPLYANTCEKRAFFLKEALLAPDSRAVWALRGGSGATRLVPTLLEMPPLPQDKLFLGFSDITALHLFLSQKWGWETVHGPNLGQIAKGEPDALTIQTVKDLVFGLKNEVVISHLTPLNEAAVTAPRLEGTLTGGNFSLMQASLGTPWQIDTDHKIVFVEDVDEKPYRTAEKIEHLHQAGALTNPKALVFFDFTYNTPVEEIHHTLYPIVLEDFAGGVAYPVFRGTGVGHAAPNLPLVIGGPARLENLALISSFS